MEKVVIKNIKRKTTLPRSEMKKAVDYAYSIKLSKDYTSNVQVRIIPSK